MCLFCIEDRHSTDLYAVYVYKKLSSWRFIVILVQNHLDRIECCEPDRSPEIVPAYQIHCDAAGAEHT